MSERLTRRLAAMSGEREDLLRSLEDLEREQAAGDITPEDYGRLRADYIARTAEILRRIEALESAFAPGGVDDRRGGGLRRALGRPRAHRLIVILLSLWLLIGACLVALHYAGLRLPGQSATGTVVLPQALTVEQELSQATALAGSGDLKDAIALYDRVLAAVPDQRQALAYQGWLIRLSGVSEEGQRSAVAARLIERGDAEIARAVALAPSYPDARALYGIVLAEDARSLPRAVAQFDAFVGDHPSAALVASFRPQVLAIYQAAGVRSPSLFTLPTESAG